jgi:acyl dehydratase
MFAVVPALLDVATTAMRSVWRSDVEGYDMRSMHGEHDLMIYKPIMSGQMLRSRAAAVGLVPKSSGTLLVTKTETRDGDALVNEMTFVNFLRGIELDSPVGEGEPSLGSAPAPDVEPVATMRYHVDPDQSFRYADASGDFGTYHVDPEAAQEAGFPGVIVHGLCTMAFAARAIVDACCERDPSKLQRLGVRFAAPLLPNQEIATRIYRDESHSGSTYMFEVDDASDATVIRRGIAEVKA